MIKKVNILIVMLFLVGLLGGVSAQTNYCCERTSEGAWCQNAPEGECDSSYRLAPTSCESTSYCKPGCCYDSSEGTCMENTPQILCEAEGGFWEDDADCVIPVCELGCCVLGDQAAFVTQTRCKRLSALYGLETTFKSTIGSEAECILQTTSETKGACIYEIDYEKNCIFTTQSKCDETEGNATFYADKLCSAEELGTICGPTEDTVCVEGKDQVYFVDSCGNLANIYDSSKIDEPEYWSNVYKPFESCGYGNSNSDSPSCGNCDYYLGSTCKDYERGEDAKPEYGNNVCRDLSCTWEGERYEHGETWCANALGTEENLPGSRYFRLVCYNGDVTVEPCADYRQEICEENEVNGFSSAACVVNKWEDCSLQSQSDCGNSDKRDCRWINFGDEGICVPVNAPGFNFWEEEGQANDICSLASATCTVVYEKDFFGSKKCVENCECLEESWKSERENACIALGDCGGTPNYIEGGFR